MCIFSHCVGTRNQQKLIFLKTQKNPIKPKKPNLYPRKGQTGIGCFWVTSPRITGSAVFTPEPITIHSASVSSMFSEVESELNT